MKKSKLSIRLSFLIITIALLSSCASQKYESLIGVESSTLLVGVNINQMLDKSEYKKLASQEIQDKVLSQLGLNKLSGPIINPFLYYPWQSGLDYSKPLYFIVDGESKSAERFSLYGAVKDYKKLIASLSASEIFDEQTDSVAHLGGFRFYKGTMKNANLFVNKDILVLTSSSDIDRITKPKASLMSHVWSGVLKPKNDIVVVYNMANFQKLVNTFSLINPDFALLNMIPAAPNSLYASSSLNFEKGKVSLAQNLYGQDEQAKTYIDNLDAGLTKTRGTWNSYLPVNPLFYLEAGIKGDQLHNFLNDIPQITRIFMGMGESTASRLKAALSSVNGDLVLSMNSLEFNLYKPDFNFSAFVESTPELLDIILEELKESSLSSLIIESQPDKLTFGDKDLVLFITRTDKGLIISNKDGLSESSMLPKVENISSARYVGRKSIDINFIIDLKQIFSNPIMQLVISGVPQYKETGFDKLFEDLDYLRISGSPSSNLTEILMTCKADNTLKLLMDVILKASKYAK